MVRGAGGRGMSPGTDDDSPDTLEVRETVRRIVAAFGDGRMDEYFSLFHPDCSFVFYTTPDRLGSVAEYRDLWDRWVREDHFEVLSCRTSDTRVQMWGDAAVVTHTVQTQVQAGGEEATLHERETIVLARRSTGGWIAVHEHLSPIEVPGVGSA